jgi:hypothetical protein
MTVELLSKPELAKAKVSLGDPVKVSARFLCDWATRPGALAFEPGSGVQSLGSAVIKLKKIEWGKAVYEVDAAMQPYRTGKSGEGLLHVAFSNGKGQPQEFDLKTPALEVEALKLAPDAKLSIAGKLKVPTPAWVWYASAGAALLIALLAGWLIWRKLFKRLPPPPPWTQALEVMAALRRRLDAEPSSAAACMTELVDVVRRYLEARFQLHARTQTSPEFLEALNRGESPLSASHRGFLREFLASADMVKFALAAADRKLLDDALLRAEKLVLETVPSEPEEAKDAKGPEGSNASKGGVK